MSFINLLANDIWSDADITNRTEAMLRSRYSATDEAVINRKVSGAGLGIYVLTPEDQAEVAGFAAATLEAQQAGVAARADMDLLRDTLAYEAAMRRLQQPAIEPVLDEAGNVTNQAEMDADTDEREVAESVIYAAPQAVVDLYALRNPPAPEPLPEPVE